MGGGIVSAQRVSGVLIDAATVPAIAKLARLGAEQVRRDGVVLGPDTMAALDVLSDTARAVAMSAQVRGLPERADIAPALKVRTEIDTSAAAGLLHCTERHVTRLIQSGKLAARKGRNGYAIERQAVDEYLAG